MIIKVKEEEFGALSRMVDHRGVAPMLHLMAIICGSRATEYEVVEPKRANLARKKRVEQKALLALAEFLDGIE